MDDKSFQTTTIGVVLDLGSRMAKEQKTAMEIAAQEFNGLAPGLLFHFHHSHGSSAASVAAVMGLARSKQVRAIIGTISHGEATMAIETNSTLKNIPILSLTSLAVSRDTEMSSTPLPYFIQLGTDITFHTRCFAAIVGEFKWPKVTAIYEQNNGVFSDPKTLALFSHSLRLVGSEIVDHSALPSLSSLSNPRVTIEKELSRLKSNNNRVFLVVQASLEMANLLFERAKQMGLMEKESVWVIPDEIAGLIDSVDSSVIINMQGVVGFKTHFHEMSETFRRFRYKFRRKFSLEYPEEENINPSIFALRSYDATWAIALAAKKSQRKFSQKEFSESILASNFEGLSGKIRFKNGKILWPRALEIVNVIGKSYRDLAFWPPAFGFSKNLARHQLMEVTKNNGSTGTLETVYWPGNLLSVPKGWTYGNEGKTLRIGVPAQGAFTHFVNVTYDQSRNKTSITGFSIDVFKAAVKRLPYHLQYEFIPVNCSYDEMVQKVYKKELDAAVGDTEIMAYRYRYVIFSQPYVESGLDMVVTVKPNKSKQTWMFTSAFTKETWLVMTAMHIFIGFIIWLMERQVNEELRGLGAMLWFLVTIIFYAHREPIKNTFARIVLAPWLFIILILTTSFTASLTSMMTISHLEPSVLDIKTLQRTNAPVGCNGNSFIVRYLTDVLKFKPKNIRKIDSISDYPTAYKNRDIEAAFFVAPHAKVFLAKYSCAGFIKAGDTFKLGGFGFVGLSFPCHCDHFRICLVK
ncbi:glutamate receptor 2.5-like [Neltuma alba]|uniref:glutamate receptor 2.5-like n=1 Tax=Neltuma alba TaxID=207710 RepID=UPI0010A2ECCC|nr:glutamate receptor 2.5-like [Prosopis alba]